MPDYRLVESVGFSKIVLPDGTIIGTANSFHKPEAEEMIRRANAATPADVADRIAAILQRIYRDAPQTFAMAAKKREITVEQLAAAAIAEMLREAK